MKKILIIEDEKPMARVLELKLNHVGFEAKAVFNGEEGINILKEDSYDLILLDLIMPKIDGFETLERIRKMNIETPVIILSNLSQEADENKARELGAKDFFIKSNTSIASIVEKVTSILKE